MAVKLAEAAKREPYISTAKAKVNVLTPSLMKEKLKKDCTN